MLKNRVRVESVCVSMKREDLRDYDPQIVTNKFAIGECIEWIDGIWQEPYEDILYAEYVAGIIKKITPYTVLIDIKHPSRRAKEERIGKRQLAHDVMDAALSEAIKTTIGQDLSPKKLPTKPSSEESPKSDTPHDAYRLRDPRDKSVFYVGISKNSKRRHKQHLACAGLNFRLNLRIQEILQRGLTPEMEIIEHAIPGAEKAREREKHWINYHTQQGDQLTNIAEMDGIQE